ncbi:hypothetical protein CPB86DRAFT_785046 [Serendipita vermifera]|nr:hypothetical protein CPB86DRAFT_785046 [Serendipita vermifera]
MTSPWKQRNELEPSGELLLRLMDKINGVWHCGFYESGVKCSSCSATRRIQAIEHVRRHIDLLPFACEGGPCPVSHDGCHKRYSSPDPLKKHREGSRNGQSICHFWYVGFVEYQDLY